MTTQGKQRRSHASTKPSTQPKRSHHKQPASAPPVKPTFAALASTPAARVVALAQPVASDDGAPRIDDPVLAKRAAAARAAGTPLAAKPGYHLVVQRGVLSEERDAPAPAAPPAKAPSLTEALRKASPAAPKAPPRPAPSPAKPTPPAKPAASAPAPATWGRAGSGAECYKRLLMTLGSKLTEAQVHAAVVKELGAANAGPLSYVAWYKNWLRKHGFTPTCGNGGK